MKTQCQPMIILEPGTPVRVGDKTGKVLSHEIKQAHPSGLIVVHTVNLTEKKIRTTPGKSKIEKINEYWQGNYSGLYYNQYAIKGE